MVDFNPLSDTQIRETYAMISGYHEKFLKAYGVSLPKLLDGKMHFTKDALTLVYLAYGYPKTRAVSKIELTKFIQSFYPDVPDVQQARHLGAQKGWWIVSGSRDNIVLKVKPSHYQLYSLEQPYPSFHGHRGSATDDWDEIKAKYGYRCATCGSQEGKPHLHWPAIKTKLQKAHMDPKKPLVEGNIIPQCQQCNRGDRNRWIYDERGRVLRPANASVIKKCDAETKQAIYRQLFKEYKGKKPK